MMDNYEYNKLPKVESSNQSVTAMVLNSLTTALLFGYSLSSINPFKNYVAIQFNWCEQNDAAENLGTTIACDAAITYGSVITVGVLVGGMFGAFTAGPLAGRGRIFSIILSHSLFLLGNLLSGVSEGILTLALGRIILGFAIGISSYCTPVYISEISPAKKRGLYGTLFQLFITVGIFIPNILGLAVSGAPENFLDLQNNPITDFEKWWWRFILGIPAVLSLFSIVTTAFVFYHETPHFMIMQQEHAKAVALLRVINQRDDVEEEYNLIINALSESKRLKSTSIPIWQALNTPQYRLVIYVGAMLAIFQQVTGINVIITNSNRLFSSVGLSANTQLWLSMAITGINVIMTFPPIYLLDKLGRRTILLISIGGMTVGVIPAFVANIIDEQANSTAIASVISTYVFIIFFAMGYGPILWVYLHEIFPIEIKQGASSFAMGVYWIASIAIVAPSDYILSLGSLVIYSIFMATNLLGFILIYLSIKETKGKSIDQSPYLIKRKNPTEVSVS